MKKYILFDNDGVLVETEPWYLKASQRALKEFFDFDFTKEDYMQLMINGGAVWRGVEALGASAKDVQYARNKRNEYYQEYILNEDISIKNVKNILKELSKSYKMAIVTSARRDDFELSHKNTGIIELMDFVLCESDYTNSKPHPEPYLKAIEKFNANKKDAIVVEDSQRGLSSAYSAGIDCIMVYNEFASTQDFSLSSYKIDSLDYLPKFLNDI